MIKFNGYSIKGFKSMEGWEGEVMRGFLTYKGKTVCEFYDDGCGSCMEFFHFENDFTKPSLIKTVLDMYSKIRPNEFLTEHPSEVLGHLIYHILSFNDFVKEARKRNNVPAVIALFERNDSCLDEFHSWNGTDFLKMSDSQIRTYLGKEIKENLKLYDYRLIEKPTASCSIKW